MESIIVPVPAMQKQQIVLSMIPMTAHFYLFTRFQYSVSTTRSTLQGQEKINAHIYQTLTVCASPFETLNGTMMDEDEQRDPCFGFPQTWIMLSKKANNT